MDTSDMQKRIQRWLETRLGADSLHPHERAMRLVEECAELAQSLGVSVEEFQRVGAHVWSKPVGDPRQELGGVGTTLLGCANACGEILSQCMERELDRIHTLPVEKFRIRQAQNIADGIGAP